MSKPKRPSSTSAIQDVVEHYSEPTFTDICCDRPDEWKAAVEAVHAEISKDTPKDYDSDRHYAEAEAAFRVGLALGRRLGGAR